ncbi:MAG: chorismate lyase [Endozoicomonas sp. (ex Botrylloides leachii)]|nr:chorismate lyase [Endozoicomonas sp. (ex Botrylloides leachii)]
MPFFDDQDKPWQPLPVIPEGISPSLASWLLDTGSLTERLKKTYQNDVKVNVIKHAWAVPTHSEKLFLGLADGTRTSIREIFLVCAGQIKIFARSVFPESSLRGEQASLLELGNKPLGEFLFAHPAVKRGTIEMAGIPAKQFNQHLPFQYTDERAWGRRSLFYIYNQPISVCEVFLPERKQA